MTRRRLLAAFLATPPKSFAVAWKRPVGQGFAGPCIAGERVLIYHRQGGEDVLEALHAATGEVVWRFAHPTSYRDDFGFDEGPRAAPVVSGGRVFLFNAEGWLHAVEEASGRKLWAVDTHRKFGVEKNFFGAGGVPLVDGNLVMHNIGGRNNAAVVAFDAATGNVKWQAGSDEASYSSGVAATIGAERQAVFFTRAGLLSVLPENGKIRWRFPWRSRSRASVNAASPLISANEVFASASYATGAVLLRVNGGDAKPVWQSEDALSNHYATSVLRNGLLFGYHGRQEEGQSLRCIEWATGKVRWNVDGFGAGTVRLDGDNLSLMRENGELVFAPATGAAFQPGFRAPVLTGVVRAYPAYANGLFLARNENTLVCGKLS